MSANRVLFNHYSEFPMSEWRWKNFTPAEIACNGTGKLMVDFHSMDCLQALRDDLGEPLVLNSGYRSPEYNREVGGVSKSQHLEAKAFDVSVVDLDPHRLEAAAKRAGFKAFGYYQHHNFLHIDTRDRAAKWGKPWPKSENASNPHAILASPPRTAKAPVGVLARPRRRRPGFAPRF